jgi:hypothetical protein
MFNKNGQIKVTQDPNKQVRKIASEDEKEYTVDDLVNDSGKDLEKETEQDGK